MFESLRLQYVTAGRRNDKATQEAVLDALRWHASRPWNRTLPDWVLALGITPDAAAVPQAPSKPHTWAALVALFNSASTDVRPPSRSPKAWAAADMLIGLGAANLIVGANLSSVRQQMALDVVWALVLAADAIESSLSPGSSETTAHAAWRSDLAAANALLADIDGGVATGATAYELEQRLALARVTPGLTSGKAALARAISIPSEPSLDRALIEAAEAVRLFFT